MRNRSLVSIVVVTTCALAACATGRSSQRAASIRSRCQAGEASACHDLAASLERERPEESDRLLGRACAMSHVESCYDLAVHEVDRAQLANAVTHYQAACERGHLPACYNLATCLVGGPCKRDEARGAVLLRQACEGGIPQACLNLGNSYLLGRGVERQPTKAAQLLQRACEAGLSLACDNLEVLRESGEFREATRACEGGGGDGCAQ